MSRQVLFLCGHHSARCACPGDARFKIARLETMVWRGLFAFDVSVNDGEIIGFCGTCKARPVDGPPTNYGELTHLYLDRALVSKGKGSDLLDFARGKLLAACCCGRWKITTRHVSFIKAGACNSIARCKTTPIGWGRAYLKSGMFCLLQKINQPPPEPHFNPPQRLHAQDAATIVAIPQRGAVRS
ncbi:MAG: GNAT superfamily N-acetyltransferase [Planctomycetota bacterium]|jgi:GNAT superfamily N-acetyltransferase